MDAVYHSREQSINDRLFERSREPIVATSDTRVMYATEFHTNFRMEKLDAHQNLRLLRPVAYTTSAG
jgi:hypothetical protein